MRRMACFLICLALLCGCNKSSKTMADFKYPFTVLLLVPGSVSDQSSNQRAYEAMQKIGEELKVNVVFKDNVNHNQIKSIISEATTRKIDFVVGVGGQMIPQLTQAALKYPDMSFAVVGRYAGNFRNFGSLSFQPSYFYLAGAAAALKSKTGKIGALVSDDLPGTKEALNAYLIGAKRVNPNIQMYDINLNSLDNTALALKCADAMKTQKVDVIYVNCNQADLQVHQWAAENNVYTIGYQDDQYKVAPKAVLTSVVIDLHKLLFNGTELVVIGKWQGRAYRYGMTDNVTRLTQFRGALSTDQAEVFEIIYRELVALRGEFPGMAN